MVNTTNLKTMTTAFEIAGVRTLDENGQDNTTEFATRLIKAGCVVGNALRGPKLNTLVVTGNQETAEAHRDGLREVALSNFRETIVKPLSAIINETGFEEVMGTSGDAAEIDYVAERLALHGVYVHSAQ